MSLNGIIAFTSGILSFFAPCVLPLVPSYLIFISRVSIDNLEEMKTLKYRRAMFLHAVVFVLGFSFVFVALGVSSSMIGYFLSTYQGYILKIGGAILIVMGLFYLNIIRIPVLDQERVVHLKEKPIGIFGTFFVGVTFCLGWSPCIGPVLSSILIIASTEGSAWRGVYLLSIYSLGLAIPFLVSAVLFNRLLGLLKKYGYLVRYAVKIMGVLLVCIGVLLITGHFGRLSQWLEQIL
ncbi:MAG TPA: cytochrome c biogenesis protein CcdA [Syntrophorhabdaceae bacterium]|nr:cytochrome c biogenesis protein CcdA [Syntrophorhabdaceae bacterium]